MKKVITIAAMMLLAVMGLSATPKSDHRDGICVVTKEQGGKDMDKKHGKIDKWLTEIGF